MENFGRYELVSKLATGGMAEIYLARQAGLEGFEKLLVVKRILPHLAENDEFVDMFLHEARIAVRLNHPNIVQIFDLGEQGGTFFIAMEYIHGEDVRRTWKQSVTVGNPIPVPLVCRIIMDAAAGLDYAHKKTDQNGQPLSIIHRDVSPQNILLSFEGAVKVVDFGIAKAADQVTHTRTGVLKGKYSYMSPEQASGGQIDQRTDQFALGVVLYELLTLTRLFKRSNELQTLAAVTECKVPPPSEVNPRVPKDLDPIVLKALARNHEERYADLHELQMALEEWLLANRQPSSQAHLSAFLKEVYAERLAKERELGGPIPRDPVSGSGSSSTAASRAASRRTGQSRSVRMDGSEKSQSRVLRRSSSSTGSRRVQGAPVVVDPPSEEVHDTTPVEVPPKRGTSQVPKSPKPPPPSKSSGFSGFVLGLLVLLAGGAAAYFSYGWFVTQMASSNVAVDAGEPPAPVADPVKYGGIRIVTVPEGATVVLGGKRLAELTPVTVTDLPMGEHALFIEKRGYLDKNVTVKLDKAEVKPVTFALQKAASADEPEDHPTDPGTRVHDPKEPVRTPKEPRHTRQPKEPKEPKDPVEPPPDEPPEPPTRVVQIDCEPQATLWQGSRQLGPTPFRGELGTGRQELMLVNRTFGLEKPVSITVSAKQTEFQFAYKRGKVVFAVKPWAEGYLRGQKLGVTPMAAVELVEGTHEFTLVYPTEARKKTVPVTILPGKLEKKTVDMLADD